MNKNETITKEYLETNFITKSYLKENYPTKNDLATFKVEIIKEFRVINHQMVKEILENAETTKDKEVERHTTALRQGFNDDLKGYKDGVKSIEEKLDNHENRISGIELKLA